MYYVPGEDASVAPRESHSRRTVYSAKSSPFPSNPSVTPPDPMVEMEERPLLYVPTPILADISHLPPIQIQDGQSLLHRKATVLLVNSHADFLYRIEAWRSVMTSDPLLDSDEENGNDDELRTDYGKYHCRYIRLTPVLSIGF